MKCNNPLREEYNGQECACADCNPEQCPAGMPCVDCNGPVKYRCEPPDLTEGDEP